jgi:hypothetical protein
MATRPTISSVSAGYTSSSLIDSNFDAIVEEFDNLLGLSGGTMTGDLDLNSNDLLNVSTLNATSVTVDGSNLVPATKVPNWRGAWVTATSYAVDDLVRNDGSSYICLEAHTSGTFSTDLSASKWELFAQKGASGAGSGDLLAANNLSDLADADTALTNLGGGTVGIAIFKDTTAGAVQTELSLVPGTDIQAYDAVLADIAGLSLSAGDLLYYDGANVVNLGAGTEGQFLRQGASSTPEWKDTLTKTTTTGITGSTTTTTSASTEPCHFRVIQFRNISHNNGMSAENLQVEFYDDLNDTWHTAVQCSPSVGVDNQFSGEIVITAPMEADNLLVAKTHWYDNGDSAVTAGDVAYLEDNDKGTIVVAMQDATSTCSKVRFSWSGGAEFASGIYKDYIMR